MWANEWLSIINSFVYSIREAGRSVCYHGSPRKWFHGYEKFVYYISRFSQTFEKLIFETEYLTYYLGSPYILKTHLNRRPNELRLNFMCWIPNGDIRPVNFCVYITLLHPHERRLVRLRGRGSQGGLTVSPFLGKKYSLEKREHTCGVYFNRHEY